MAENRQIIKSIHEKICYHLYSTKNCSLHFKKMRRKTKLRLLSFIKNHSELFRNIIICILVVKGKMKSKSRKIMNEIRRIISEGRSIRKFIVPRDFEKFVKDFKTSFENIVEEIIENEREDGTELADILANYYRITRERNLFREIILI